MTDERTDLADSMASATVEMDMGVRDRVHIVPLGYERDRVVVPPVQMGADVVVLVMHAGDDPEESAIEEPDRVAPRPVTPEADNPVSTARFEARGAVEYVVGLARLYEGADGFTVEVTLDGLPAGDHAWHIHQGDCDAGGPIAVALTPAAGQSGLSAPLNVPAEDAPTRGAADVPSSSLSLDQVMAGEYSLHVHASAGDSFGPTVACANLAEQVDDATY